MNKNNNIEEIKDAKGEVTRTLVFTDKDGVRTYKDKDTGEVVKTLHICNGGVSEEQIKVWKNEHRRVHMFEVVRMGAIRQLGELFNSVTSRLKNV